MVIKHRTISYVIHVCSKKEADYEKLKKKADPEISICISENPAALPSQCPHRVRPGICVRPFPFEKKIPFHLQGKGNRRDREQCLVFIRPRQRVLDWTGQGQSKREFSTSSTSFRRRRPRPWRPWPLRGHPRRRRRRRRAGRSGARPARRVAWASSWLRGAPPRGSRSGRRTARRSARTSPRRCTATRTTR